MIRRWSLHQTGDRSVLTERSVKILKSVFENSAVDIRSTESNLDVTISNCTFSFSNKGTLFMLPPGYVDDTLPRFGTRRITIGNLQITDTLFHDNKINSVEFGMGIFHVAYTNLIVSNCHFINNSWASDGILVFSSSLILKNTSFLHSRSRGLHLKNSSGTNDASLFASNSSYIGGGLHLRDSSGTIDACLFANNSAYKDGGVLLIENSHLSISNSIFEGNSGTALNISTCTLRIEVSNCTFRNNSGKEGGALYVRKAEDVIVLNSTFIFNKALGGGGGAIYCVDSRIISRGAIHSFSNSAETSNGGYAYFSNCFVRTNGEHNNNWALNGGAIFAEHETRIIFNNDTTLTNNIAYKNGGAIYLDESKVNIYDAPVLSLSNNVAKKRGGAIFTQDTNCDRLDKRCPIQFTNPPVLNFTNNTAPVGSVLYGGLLDRCYVNYNRHRKLGIDALKSVSKYEHTPRCVTYSM